MPKYNIYSGLSGGFGGATLTDIEVVSGSFGGASLTDIEVECENQEQADMIAYDSAVEIYGSYDGFNGLLSIEEIMDEEGCDENDALVFWEEQREDWLDYYAVLSDEDDSEEYLNEKK